MQAERNTSRTTELRKVVTGDFVKGVSRLAGGTVLAQVILLASTPLLTRLYSPQDYGALAAYLAVTQAILVVAAGRYELAIMLPKNEGQTAALLALSLLLLTATSTLTLVVCVVLLALDVPIPVLGAKELLLIPPTVLIAGAGLVFGARVSKGGQFGAVGGAAVLRQSATVSYQLTAGFVQPSRAGLLLGSLVGNLVGATALARTSIRSIRTERPGLSEVVDVARRYKKFPLNTMPAGILNAIAVQGGPLVVGALAGPAVLGVWAVAMRLVGIPSSLLGQAVGEVYYQRAASRRDDPREGLRLFDQTVLGLAAASLLPFAAIGLLAPTLFTVALGPEWREAGEYTRIMLPWLWVNFVSSPISRTTLVYDRNELGLIVQGLLLAALLGSWGAAAAFGLAFNSFLWILSLSSATAYLAALLVYRRLIKRSGLTPDEGDHEES